MRRRSLLKAGATLPVLAALPVLPTLSLAAGDAGSPLIYLSPLQSDGSLSRCQAEVWFIGDQGNYYVVTAADAWRAKAIAQGLTQTQVWVGDVGAWQSADGKWRDLPSAMTQASLEADAVAHARLLTIFGRKYADEWGTWGPRFSDGLVDGSRVMLKYSPA